MHPTAHRLPSSPRLPNSIHPQPPTSPRLKRNGRACYAPATNPAHGTTVVTQEIQQQAPVRGPQPIIKYNGQSNIVPMLDPIMQEAIASRTLTPAGGKHDVPSQRTPQVPRQQLLVQWQYWVDDGVDSKVTGWHDFTKESSEVVEQHYQDVLLSQQAGGLAASGPAPTVEVTSGACRYQVNMQGLRQINMASGRVREVRRAVAPAVAPPQDVQWQFWVDDGSEGRATGWHCLDAQASATVEQHYQKVCLSQQATVPTASGAACSMEVSSGGRHLAVDMLRMRQKDLVSGRVREVRRAVAPAVAPPQHVQWQCWVDDGSEGRATGWHCLDAQASEVVEQHYQDVLLSQQAGRSAASGPAPTVEVTSGACHLLVNVLQLRQVEPATGRHREVRRALVDQV